jgi:hypothetical protein
MRPARISSIAVGTSVNGWLGLIARIVATKWQVGMSLWIRNRIHEDDQSTRADR